MQIKRKLTSRIIFVLAAVSLPLAISAVTLTGNVQMRGNLNVIGALSKGSGTFVIDHPLDPKNKLLYHSFVESPDVKNIYDGIATLDAKGEAVIQLPSYFMALNTDVRYQLFPHKTAMPELYISGEALNNTFKVSGGEPFGEITWQVSGNRKDPYILANPIVPEVLKGPNTLVKKGECIYEPACATTPVE